MVMQYIHLIFAEEVLGSKSDGETTDMSVLTEVSDLETILEEARTWDFIDTNNLNLFGTSQGGLVSALVGAKNEEKINGLILFYPAFMITDDIHNMYPTKENIPETTNYLGWINVGRNYMLDVYDMDFYGEVKNYQKEVLIVHGSSDNIVDLKYSQKLNETYENSELEIITGAEHGFYGQDFDRSITYILKYLRGGEVAESVQGKQIKMTTNNTEVIITLNDSKAAVDLVNMLPLELRLIERNNFAKGMTLPEHLSSEEETTRQYQIGDFGYWNAGPDLAIFYDDIYEKTIVDVIPLGHAEKGAESLANETGTVRLELIK